jgi:hypothetical protein
MAKSDFLKSLLDGTYKKRFYELVGIKPKSYPVPEENLTSINLKNKTMIEVRKVKAYKEENVLGIEALCDVAGKEHKSLGNNVIQITGEHLDGVISDIRIRLLGIEI